MSDFGKAVQAFKGSSTLDKLSGRTAVTTTRGDKTLGWMDPVGKALGDPDPLGGLIFGNRKWEDPSKKPQPSTPAPTAPAVAPPPSMPTADDAQVQEANRRKLLEETQRRGRAATILTTPNFPQTLG